MQNNETNNSRSEEGLRLNRAMAQAGLCSRRAADEWICAGRVSVNGVRVLEPGRRLFTGDVLEVDGKSVSWESAQTGGMVYLMLNKPVQVVSTVKDPEGRQTVLGLVPEKYRQARLYPVGRLDYFSEGLLLLTNDGDLTHRLTHPRFHLPKRYLVVVREEPSPAALETMRNGMVLAEGEKLAPVAVELSGKTDPESRINGHMLHITLSQGVNRQIRRMCRDLGLTILRLVRVEQGPLELGGLEPGQCRALTVPELASLRRAVGFQPE